MSSPPGDSHRRWRVAVAGCGLLLAAGCAGETPATPLTSGDSSSSTSAVPAFDGTVVDVVVADGEVMTSNERVIVTLDTAVRLVVASDIDDELHVHGIDEYVELQAGRTATHDFIASVPGTFEVELHGSGDLLFTLQIEP